MSAAVLGRGTILAGSLLASVAAAAGDRVRWDARRLFERSIGSGVELSEDGRAVELRAGVLYEDDGPAAGYSYRPNEEPLAKDVRVRKDLVIDDPRARAAMVLVAPGGELAFHVNGRPVEAGPPRKTGGYWQAWPFDPAALRPGRNEVAIGGTGKVWIARADDFPPGAAHPQRSARSGDGGKTWARDRLGPDGDIAGEYYVRILLDQHPPSGSLVLPVIDIGNLGGDTIAPFVKRVESVDIRVQAEGDVAVRVRSGATPRAGDGWNDWSELSGRLEHPAGRYLEVALELWSADPRRTPRVESVEIEAEVSREGDWTRALRVVECVNDEIARTSVPYEYEAFDHPKLRELRERYGLDAVVAEARSELELLGRLSAWAATRWTRGHLDEAYPPWDALAILAPHPDGTPWGGFCLQQNLVFLQACESFGFTGRVVSIGPGDGGAIRGGHEAVEVWSDEYGKWIYIDGSTAWLARDRETGTPLSLLELRERQLAAFRGEPYRPIRVVELAETRFSWKDLTSWPPFVELRLIPRSNFLAKPAPVPVHQGMRGWFWTGHRVWTDAAAPASPIYSHRLTRRGDWEWTPNRVRLALEPLEEGTLRVHLDTVTPGLRELAAEIDGAPARVVESGFVWPLHGGRNSIGVRARNIAGREGPPSRVVLEYAVGDEE